MALGLIFRWIARLGSLASMVLLGLFAFGGQEQLAFNSNEEMLGFAFFPVGVVAGFVLAWKWELIGSGVSLLSLAGFYVWHFANSGDVATGPWFAIFSSPALLFLLAAILTSKSTGRSE